MDIQTLIEHPVFYDAVSFLRSHRACPQAVPGTLDVALDPLLNGLNIVAVVLELVADLLGVRVEDVGRGLLLRLGEWAGPAAVADACGVVAGLGVGLGGQEVQVMGPGGGVVGEEWVLSVLAS